MGVELQKHDHYARIEPCLIEEFPADAENTVLCSVGVHTVIYDARVLPGVPLRSCARHAFRARALLDGFVVDYLR